MSRPRMPHNNRVSGSVALQTNDIWSKTIGFDPYAADNEAAKRADEGIEKEHAAGLMMLMKMSNIAGSESRGSCKKCGNLGHLTFQCRNTIATNKDEPSSDSSSSEDDSDNDESEKGVIICESRGSRMEGRNAESARRSRSRSRDREPMERHDRRDQERSSASKSSKKSKKEKKSSKDNKKKSKKEKKSKKHSRDK